MLLLFGLFLILFSGGKRGAEAEIEGDSLSEYKASLESELSELCSRVKGVGKCYVTVSFERGEQNSYKGSALIESKPPRVLGVSIVCQGADSDIVKSELSDMMCALFDIGANRVSVLKLS